MRIRRKEISRRSSWVLSCLLAFSALLTACAPSEAAPPPTTTSTSAQASKEKDIEGSLTFEGRRRSYILHLPRQYSGTATWPLAILLHGGGGSAQGMDYITGMNAEADRQGFVVVYPNGTGRLGDRVLTWNAGNCCGYALENQVNDVGFISALIDELVRTYRIDPMRVYAGGLSNGGMMSYRLGCELAGKIAAIAPVAGAMNLPGCRPSQPVAVLTFHGTDDQHVPYEGGSGSESLEPRVDQPVSHAINFWVAHNACSIEPERTTTGSIVHEAYGGCNANAAVQLYTIVGGGHAWPGGRAYLPNADPPTQEISASRLMLEFFAAHPKPASATPGNARALCCVRTSPGLKAL